MSEPPAFTPPRLVILMGLQASGKSSFAQARLAETHVVLSKDDWPNLRRKQLRLTRLLEAHLHRGESVVIDNTNPSPADRAPLIALAVAASAKVTGYWFESDVDACLQRNRGRDGRRRVPDVGVLSTVARLRRPTVEEGFDELHLVRLVEGDDGEDGRFEVEPWRMDPDGQ